MNHRQMVERAARAARVDMAALRIECYVGQSEAERYRQEIQGWIETGVSPYLWDNAMPLIREDAEDSP